MRILEASGVVLLIAVICIQCASTFPEPSQVISNEIKKPGLLEMLANVIRESRGEIQKSKSMKVLMSTPERQALIKPSKNGGTSKGSFRGEVLRQELAKETQDNCLAKLLCGANNQKPSTFTPINDYAYLVKEFFEFFGEEDPTEAEKDDPKDKVASSTKDKDKKEEDEKEEETTNDDDEEEDSDARSNETNIESNSTNPTDGNSTDELTTTSTSATVTSVTTGATITEIPVDGEESKNIHKVTLEELVGHMMLTPQDVASMRQSRQSRNLKISMGELRQSAFIHRKLREMQLAKSDTKKLRIAGQIATSIRQPIQCREFNSVASEVLSTCPLTTEVVRYFNSNLKNGSQIAFVRQNQTNAAPSSPGAGLVVLNQQNRPQVFLLDNSPIVANTRINTDLKNPTVSERYSNEDYNYQVYENAFPQKQNVNNVKLENTPEEKKEKEKDGGESDEDDDDSYLADDDDNEDDGEEEEDEENDENDDVENDDEGSNNASYEEEEERRRKLQPYKKVKAPKKRPTKPTAPPGMIKVYGVPQPSFDNEFTNIADQIGQHGPVVIFDQDDYDGHISHPGTPPVETPRPRPVKKSQPLQKITLKQNQKRSHYRVKSTKKPLVTSASASEEDEEDEEEFEVLPNVFKNNYTPSMQGPPRPYGSYPRPRPPNEYFRHSHSLPPPNRPSYSNEQISRMPNNVRPEANIRARLNFVHSPGANLMRPYYHENNFRYLGK